MYVFKAGNTQIKVTAATEDEAWEAMLKVKNEIEVNYDVSLPPMFEFTLFSAA